MMLPQLPVVTVEQSRCGEMGLRSCLCSCHVSKERACLTCQAAIKGLYHCRTLTEEEQFDFNR